MFGCDKRARNFSVSGCARIKVDKEHLDSENFRSRGVGIVKGSCMLELGRDMADWTCTKPIFVQTSREPDTTALYLLPYSFYYQAELAIIIC